MKESVNNCAETGIQASGFGFSPLSGVGMMYFHNRRTRTITLAMSSCCSILEMTLKETHIHFVEWEYNHNASDADWENRKVQSAGNWNVFRLTGTLASTGFNHM